MKKFLCCIVALFFLVGDDAQAASFGSYAQVSFVEVPKVDIAMLMDAITSGNPELNVQLISGFSQQMEASLVEVAQQNADPVFEVLVACN